MTQFSSEVFKAFLSLYWLRPENGALAYYQSQSWQDVKVKGPSIDISTGDGFSIFLHCGEDSTKALTSSATTRPPADSRTISLSTSTTGSINHSTRSSKNKLSLILP